MRDDVNSVRDLLRELALHLSHDSQVSGRKNGEGEPVGTLSLSEKDGSLWKRVIDAIGSPPDMIRDIDAPTVQSILRGK